VPKSPGTNSIPLRISWSETSFSPTDTTTSVGARLVCNTLQHHDTATHTATLFNTLQHTTSVGARLVFNTLQHKTLQDTTLQHYSTHDFRRRTSRVLHSVAVCDRVLQFVAVRGTSSECAQYLELGSVLQCVAVCCSVLQCVAVCDSAEYLE